MGITRTQNDTQCREAAETVSSFLYLAPSVLNSFSSIGSFVMFVAIYVRFSFRMYYPTNAKILLCLNMLSHLIFALATFINYGTLFINAISATHDCDFLFTTSSCSILRRVFLFCTTLIATSQAAMILERLHATYVLMNYEKPGKSIGPVLALICVIGSFIITTIVTAVEEPSELLTNCFAFSSSTIGSRAYKMFIFQFIIYIFSWIVYWGLKQYLSKVSVIHEGNLNIRYQAFENFDILKTVLPCLVFSSMVISCYILFSTFGYCLLPYLSLVHYKQLAAIIFIMPHISFFSMILYFFIFKWSLEAKIKRRYETVSPSTDRKDYFTKLNGIWEEGFRNKGSGNVSPRSVQKIGFEDSYY